MIRVTHKMFCSIPNQGSLSSIKKKLSALLAKPLELKESDIYAYLEQPLNTNHGHLALPVFSFSKLKNQNPKQMAQEMTLIINQLKLPFLQNTESLSGFINFKFTDAFLKSQLEQLISKKQLAFFKNPNPEHWIIDFASPNVAKYMNIGHLRATVIGQALVNLIGQFGYKVTSLNHLGDWGSQFGKLLWAYQTWNTEYDFKNKAFESLVKLYIRFHKEAEQDPNKLKEATNLFQKLEAGDSSLKKLWKNFVSLSLKNYDQYWKILNVQHNLVLGESFYIQFIDDLKRRLKTKNHIEESDGAQVVFLKDSPPCIIVKSDGASTYAARELSSAIYRFEKLKADKNIYITGTDQKLHFKQVFQTLNKLSTKWEKNCLHLSFGMYRFKGEGKMSTRKGQAIYLKDVLEQSIQRVHDIITKRRPELKNKHQIAEQVGVGAIVFNDLINDRIKDVDFNWNKILDFEGNSGPFVQYTYVRCLSLLKKTEQNTKKTFSKTFPTSKEVRLLWLLLLFEEAVFQSFKHFKPHILARYLLDLSREFNHLYASKRILDSENKDDLVLLVDIIRRILHKGLSLLNIPTPSSM